MGWHKRPGAWGKHKRRKAPARFESINRELRELIAGGRRESVSLRNLLSGGESSSHEEKSVHTMSRALHNKTLVFLLRMRRAMGLCVRGGGMRDARASEERPKSVNRAANFHMIFSPEFPPSHIEIGLVLATHSFPISCTKLGSRLVHIPIQK